MRPGVSRRELFGWALYDFANSTFATTILILYSRYFAEVVAGGPDSVLRIGTWSLALPGATLYSYTVAAAMFVVAACTPVLGAAADYSGRKRSYLAAFCALGVLATALMVLVGPGDILLGAVLLLVGLVGFNSANVFYNAFLPEISTPEDIGRISGFGWGFGYLGGGALLGINLVMLGAPELLGRSEPFPIQACFLSVAVWWGGFSIPSLMWMRDRPSAAPAVTGIGYVRAGFRRVRETFRNLRRFTELPKFLAAYLVYNDGIQTVILMASIFGAEVLGMSEVDTVGLFLMIQGTALVGSTALGLVADRLGNKRTVIVTLTVWSALVVWAYFLGILGNPLREFWVLGGIAGLVLGGSQAASRAIMGSMTPESHGAEFFAFYGIVGKFAAVFGPLTYGSMVALTGDVRSGILALAVFFLTGLGLLVWVDVPLGRRQASEAAT